MGQGVVIGCCCNQPIKFFVYILALNARTAFAALSRFGRPRLISVVHISHSNGASRGGCRDLCYEQLSIIKYQPNGEKVHNARRFTKVVPDTHQSTVCPHHN